MPSQWKLRWWTCTCRRSLRLLEMLRDKLKVDRLVTAAIEASARARMRRAPDRRGVQ